MIAGESSAAPARPPHQPTGASLVVVIGVAVAFVGVMVLHAVRSDVDPLRDVMSHYANGSHGPADERRVLRLRRRRAGPRRSGCARRSTSAASPGRSPCCSSSPASRLIAAGVFEVDRPLAPQTIQEAIHSNAAVARVRHADRRHAAVLAGLPRATTAGGPFRWAVARPGRGRRRSAAVGTQLAGGSSWSGCRPTGARRSRARLVPAHRAPRPPQGVRRVMTRRRSSCADAARPWWRSRWTQAVLSLAVVALIFGFFFPKVADYGEVWKTITAMTPIELGTLAPVAAWNIVSYWPMLTAVQPGLRMREAAVANLASTAVANTVPGGGALGIGVTMTMQRSWGIPVSADRAGHGRVGRSGTTSSSSACPSSPSASSRSAAAPARRSPSAALVGLLRARRGDRRCSPCCCAASTWPAGSARPPAGSPSAVRRRRASAPVERLGRAGGRVPRRRRRAAASGGGSGSR